MNCYRVLLFASFVTIFATQALAVQQIWLYDGESAEESENGYFTTQNQPDMSALSELFPTVESICTDGSWLVYDIPNFTTFNTFLWKIEGVGIECGALEFPTPTSMRYVGNSSDYSFSGVSLYEDQFFEGEQFFSSEDVSDYSGSFISVIFSGPIPDELIWSLYLEPDFKGQEYCLQIYVFDVRIYGIQPGSIRSFRKGCSANAKVIGGEMKKPFHRSDIV